MKATLFALSLVSILSACATSPDYDAMEPTGTGFNPLTARAHVIQRADTLARKCPSAGNQLVTVRAQLLVEAPASENWNEAAKRLGRLEYACEAGRPL